MVASPEAVTTAVERTSHAFGDGDPIHREHGFAERNVDPPLSGSDVLDDAVSLVPATDDPDAVEPAGTCGTIRSSETSHREPRTFQRT